MCIDLSTLCRLLLVAEEEEGEELVMGFSSNVTLFRSLLPRRLIRDSFDDRVVVLLEGEGGGGGG